jgi:hypothetical protein
MAADRNRTPIDQILDAVVFAPLGLLLELQRETPRLADRARTEFEGQFRTARVIGEFAVKQGRRELSKRLGQPATPQRVQTPPSAPAAIESTASLPDERELPIVGYELLSAAQLVGLLADLSQTELTEVEQFERANRNRKTVLGKIAQLRP